MTSFYHNHNQFPMEWRILDDTKKQIDEQIIENPSIKNVKSLSTMFFNKK